MATKAPFTKYMTPVFRLTFWHNSMFKAGRMNEAASYKFGCTAIWTPAEFGANDKVLWTALTKALDEKAQEFFKKPWKQLPADVKRGLRNGEEKDFDGFGKGTWFANLTTTERPGVVDMAKKVISPEEGNADQLYPGCYCRATVTVYGYNKVGKGVAIGLSNLQKVKDGDRLDNRVAAENDFDDDVDALWLGDAEAGTKDEDDIGF